MFAGVANGPNRVHTTGTPGRPVRKGRERGAGTLTTSGREPWAVGNTVTPTVPATETSASSRQVAFPTGTWRKILRSFRAPLSLPVSWCW